MPVQITGLVSHNRGTPLLPAAQDEFDVDAIIASARAQEAAGYDQVLIANNATMPDSHTMGMFVAANTTRLGLLMAHRPGFIAPTMAARMLATIDRLSKGRLTVHIIAGPSDKELEADGDFTTKADRYARAREYVDIMRRIWSATAPIDHDGRFYRFNHAYAPIKPVDGHAVPVSWAGTSPASIEACGECADIFAMSGDSLANITETMEQARAAADRAGRKLDFLMTVLVILGKTEDEAWEKADRVLEEFLAMKAKVEGAAAKGPSNFSAASDASDRVLATAARGARQDGCLWMGVTEAAQGRFGNQTTLVGTPEQVTDALMDYYRAGVTRFLIRGFRPDSDIVEYGETLFPVLRGAVAQYDLAHSQLEST
jgi:alkanesulfonate monooxygenase